MIGGSLGKILSNTVRQLWIARTAENPGAGQHKSKRYMPKQIGLAALIQMDAAISTKRSVQGRKRKPQSKMKSWRILKPPPFLLSNF